MNQKIIFCLLLVTSIRAIADLPEYEFVSYQADTQWAIIGGGPAGITAIGLLIDLGIPAQDITWIDPEFNAGRIGKYYENVPANVKNKKFIQFLHSCKLFDQCSGPGIHALIHEFDPECEYPLKVIVKPLLELTEFIRDKVNSIQDVMTSLHFENDVWNIDTTKKSLTAAHVILATGSYPRTLDYKECTNQIPLDLALDRPTLAKLIEPTDSVAVVGSSHSAILVCKFLTEISTQRILNFYKHPLIYDREEVGLLGETAQWAKEVLAVKPPANLLRIYNTPEARKAWLPICNKIIYAIGYTQNPLPIDGHLQNEINYDDKTGTIGPRLFGLGIAFPETFIDPECNCKINKVGLLGFMNYAQKVIPEWIKTKEPFSRFSAFDDLFVIDML